MVAGVLRGPLGELFDARQLLTDVSGSGNNWAHGFACYGRQHGAGLSDLIRGQVGWSSAGTCKLGRGCAAEGLLHSLPKAHNLPPQITSVRTHSRAGRSVRQPAGLPAAALAGRRHRQRPGLVPAGAAGGGWCCWCGVAVQECPAARGSMPGSPVDGLAERALLRSTEHACPTRADAPPPAPELRTSTLQPSGSPPPSSPRPTPTTWCGPGGGPGAAGHAVNCPSSQRAAALCQAHMAAAPTRRLHLHHALCRSPPPTTPASPWPSWRSTPPPWFRWTMRRCRRQRRRPRGGAPGGWAAAAAPQASGAGPGRGLVCAGAGSPQPS